MEATVLFIRPLFFFSFTERLVFCEYFTEYKALHKRTRVEGGREIILRLLCMKNRSVTAFIASSKPGEVRSTLFSLNESLNITEMIQKLPEWHSSQTFYFFTQKSLIIEPLNNSLNFCFNNFLELKQGILVNVAINAVSLHFL